jgi:FlaA1/EpsC-like NDP-sugar epimerase
MEDYIEKSAALMAGLNRQIEAVVAQSKELIVWGTGQLAMKLLCESALARARIVACVDSNRVHQGKRLRGIRVLKPEEMRVPNVPVVLATLLHIEPIRARIQALGWNNPVITLSSS